MTSHGLPLCGVRGVFRLNSIESSCDSELILWLEDCQILAPLAMASGMIPKFLWMRPEWKHNVSIWFLAFIRRHLDVVGHCCLNVLTFERAMSLCVCAVKSKAKGFENVGLRGKAAIRAVKVGSWTCFFFLIILIGVALCDTYSPTELYIFLSSSQFL